MRTPDEGNHIGRVRNRAMAKLAFEERLRLSAARVQAAEEALASAAPDADQLLLRRNLARMRGGHSLLLRNQQRAS